MVAIVSGNSLGLNLTSLGVMGDQGTFGTADEGRNGQQFYVNAFNGNLVVQHQDSYLAGRGLDVSSVLTYNSEGLLTDDNADNFSLGYYRNQLQLTGTAGGSGSKLVRTAFDGSQSTYTWDGTQYTASNVAGRPVHIAYDSIGKTYTWTDPGTQEVEVYDATSMRLMTRADDAGNKLTYGYDSTSGLLTSVKAANGDLVQYEYDPVNTSRLLDIRTTIGTTTQVISYGYDTQGRLKTVTVDLTATDGSIGVAPTFVTTYGYDGASTRVTSVKQSDGTNLTIGYVQVGAVYRVQSIQNAIGDLTQFDYTVANQTTVTVNGQSTVYVYDASGQITSVTDPAVNGVSAVRTFTYTTGGDVASVVDGEGHKVTMTYDANGNQVMVRDQAGSLTTRTFDAQNRLLTESTSPLCVPGMSQQGTPPPGQSTPLVVSGGDVTKKYGNNAWDAAVRSGTPYSGSAAVSFDATATNTAVIVGLNADVNDTDPNYASIDYAIYLTDGGQLQVRENGAAFDLTTSYAAGDTLSVIYDGSKVEYLKNGQVLRTVLATISGQIYMDSSFYTVGAKITNVRWGAAAPTAQTSTLVNTTGMTIAGDDLTKSGNVNNAWDSGVRGTTGMSGGATVSFTAGTKDRDFMVGLNADPDTDNSYASLDFAFYCTSTGALAAYENGQSVALTPAQNYNVGDRLSIVYDGATSVTYYRNGTLVRTTTLGAPITKPLFVDSSFATLGAKATDVRYGLANPTTLTTRYVYSTDGKGLLRFTVSPEGRVCEYGYDSYGQLTSKTEYIGSTFSRPGLASGMAPSLADMLAFRAGADLTQTQRTDYNRDARGQLAYTQTYTTSNADGTFSGASRTTYVYDPFGRLLQKIGAGTQPPTFNYVYDGLGRIVSASDPDKGLTTTGYDDAHFKVTVTQPTGLITSTTFDKAGNAVTVSDSTSAGWLRSTTYAYDKHGNLLMTTDPTFVRTFSLYDAAGRKDADIDGNGTLTEYRYNQNDQVTRTLTYLTPVPLASLYDSTTGLPKNPTLDSIRPTGESRSAWVVYSNEGKVSQTIDALGAVTQSYYDANGNLTSVRALTTRADTSSLGDEPASQSISWVGTDEATRYFYDGDGKLLATLDGEHYLTEYAYDGAGRQVSKTAYATLTNSTFVTNGTLDELRPAASADDQVTVTLYDDMGRATGQIDPEGYLMETTYYVRSTVNKVIRYATKVGTPVTFVGRTVDTVRPALTADDRTTAYSYDLDDRLTSTVNYEGTTTATTYDPASDEITVVGSGPRHENFRYDIFGRVTAKLDGIGSALLVDGQSQSDIDAIWAQYATTYAYDSAGRLTSMTEPPLPTQTAGSKTLYFYDVDGHLTHIVDAKGDVEERTYDAYGELTGITRYGTPISRSGLSGGLVTTTLTNAIAAVADATKDAKSSSTYKADGTLDTTTDEAGQTISRGYDSFGNVTSTTTLVNSLTGQTRADTFSFDRRDQMTAQHQDTAVTNVGSSFKYDAFGRRYSSTVAGDTTLDTFDRLGRVVQTVDPMDTVNATSSSTTYDPFGQVLTHTDSLRQTTTYVYDRAGRSVTMTTPEGVQVVTTHNMFGEVETVTTTVAAGTTQASSYYYDLDGNLHTHFVAGKLQDTRTYDSAHRLLQQIDANGNTVDYTYDSADHVLTRTVDAAGLNLVTSYAYTPRGQAWQVTDPNGYLTQYTFDLDGRVVKQLVGATGVKLTTSYTYDEDGNTLSVTDASGTLDTYTYDNLGRRIGQVLDAAAGGLAIASSYAYDATGNMVTRVDGVGTPAARTTRYVYNADNQVVYVVDANGGTTYTEYDDDGRVVRTTRYATAIGLSGLSTSPTASQVAARVHAASGQDQVDAVWYDRDGRARFHVDGAGGVVEYRYNGLNLVTDQISYAAPIDLARWPDITVDPTSLITPSTAGVGASQDLALHFVYDGLGRVTQRQTNMVNAQGTQYWISQSYTYDGNGNVVAQTDGSTYTGNSGTVARTTRNVFDADNRLTYSVDAAGDVTYNEYDKDGNLVRTTQYATAMSATDYANLPIPPTADYLKSHVTAAPGKDEVMTYVYDQAGRRTWTVDGTGAAVYYVYNGDGNVVNTTSYAKRIDLTQWDYIGTPKPPVVADSARDRWVRNQYDGVGRLLFTADPMGSVTGMTYDAVGNVVSRMRYSARISTSVAASAIGGAVTLTPGQDRLELFRYNAAGARLWSSDGTGAVTNTQVDALGRVTVATQFATALTTYDINTDISKVATDGNNDRVTRNFYDGAGRVYYQLNPIGYVTRNYFDALGRVTSTTRFATQWWSTDPVNNPVPVSGGDIHATDASHVDRTDSYVYDVAGRVVQHTDAMGGVEKWSYDGAARKIGYTNQKGAYTAYTYDAAGNLATMLAPSAAVSVTTVAGDGTMSYGEAGAQILTTYSYDALGNLTSMTEASGRAEARTTAYAYDACGRQIGVTYPPVDVYVEDASLAWRDGRGAGVAGTSTTTLRTQTFYDAFGDAVANVDTAGRSSWKTYDLAGNVHYAMDAMGYITLYARDTFGDATTVKHYYAAGSTIPSTPSSAADAPTDAQMATYVVFTSGLDRSLVMTYDQAGRILTSTQPSAYTYDSSTTDPANADNNGTAATASAVTTNTYDAFGGIVKVSKLLNSVSGATLDEYRYYDRAGRQVATIDPVGNLTEMQYDFLGNLTSYNEYYNPYPANTTWGIGKRPANPDGSLNDHHTLYEYDTLDRKTKQSQYVRYSDGLDGTATSAWMATTFGYDAVGNMTRSTDAGGNSTFTYYDAMDRIVAVIAPTRLVNGAAANPITEFRHDAFGNVVEQIQHLASATNVAENTGISYYGNRLYTVVANPSGDRITQTRFDALGHATETLDAEGKQHYTAYMADGQVGKTWMTVTGSVAAGETRFTSYHYDALGRVDVTYTMNGARTGNITTQYAYNAFGEMTLRTVGGKNVEQNDYDVAGRLWRTIGTDGVVKIYLYDLLGRTTSILKNGGGGSFDANTGAFTPGGANLVTATNASGAAGNGAAFRTNYHYDKLGNVVATVDGARYVSVIPGGSTVSVRPVIYQTNDRWGNVLTRSSIQNKTWITNFTYDQNNNLVTQVTPDSGDGMGTATTTYFYDRFGQQTAVRNARGYLNGSVLDGAGEITKDQHADGGSVTYTYDMFGERASITDGMGHQTNYAYDRLGRQVTATHLSVAVSSWDSGSNWDPTVNGTQTLNTSTLNVVDRFTYDELGEKTSQTSGIDAQVTSYKYDGAGNVAEVDQPAVNGVVFATTATYDDLGHKITEKDAYGKSQSWTFDAYGHMTASSDLSAKAHTYYYDYAWNLMRITSDWGQDERYVYNAAGVLTSVTDHEANTNNSSTYNVSNYTVDIAGNRLSEKSYFEGTTTQDVANRYDRLGRLVEVSQTLTGTKNAQTMDIVWTYDKDGNRLSELNASQNVRNYFHYDTMDRQDIVNGAMINNSVGINQTQGIQLGYDYNGNRATEHYFVPAANGYSGDWAWETYTYDQMDREKTVEWKGGTMDYIAHTAFYDGAGRVVKTTGNLNANSSHPAEIAPYGKSTVETLYDAAGRAIKQMTVDGNINDRVTIDNSYIDQVGNVRGYTEWHGTSRYSDHSIGFRAGDTYQKSYDSVMHNGMPTEADTGFDANGFVIRVTDGGMSSNNRELYNDANGQALTIKQANTYIENELVSNGQVMARYGTGQTATNGDGSPVIGNVSDYGTGYVQGSDSSPGSATGTYVVDSGDTLVSIAAAVYGDGQLWYRIAEANGLSDSSNLHTGQVLTIPYDSASGIHNSTSTSLLYDQSKAVGSMTPTIPQPHHKGCGAIGTIIMVVVAVVVTIYTAGAAAELLAAADAAATTAAGGVVAASTAATAAGTAGAMSIGGSVLAGSTALGISAGEVAVAAAIGGAVGSIASQGIGDLIGAHEGFSWKEVGTAAVGSAVTAGVGSSALGQATFAGHAVVTAMAVSAASQGVNAVLFHTPFSWRAVAGAAAGAEAAGLAGDALNMNPDAQPSFTMQDTFDRTLRGFAGGVASTAVTKGSVNFGHVAADAFGNALAESIVAGVRGVEQHAYQTNEVKSALTSLGVPYAVGDDGSITSDTNRKTVEYVQSLVSHGMTGDEAKEYVSQPSVSSALAHLDFGASGRTDVQIDALVKATVQAANQPPAPQPAPAQPVDPAAPQVVVVTGSRGPSGDSVIGSTLSGGLELLDGFVDFYQQHPRLAKAAYAATKTVLTGGPVKSVLTSLGSAAIGDTVDNLKAMASTYVQDKVSGWVTGWATDRQMQYQLNMAGGPVDFGPNLIGDGAGRLAGSAADMVLDGGAKMLADRGAQFRDYVQQSMRNAGRGAPRYKKWINERGHTVYSNLEDHTVTYERKDGVKVTYRPGPDGNVYPDFTPYLNHPSGVTKVTIPEGFSPTGDRTADFRRANELAKHEEWGSKPPKDYTWHHAEDGTMQLVPTDIHADFSHYGGVFNAKQAAKTWTNPDGK